MRAVLQRVKRAGVSVDGVLVGSIEKGLLVYLGVEKGDEEADVSYIAEKVRYLRIFGDNTGQMNLDVTGARGAVLVVSQFTLLADCRKGRRPSFSAAESPQKAEVLYGSFISSLREKGLTVESGVFGAHMEVECINDGPVTMLLESRVF